MTTLTTSILKENIVEILPVVASEDSFFSKVGVKNITVSNLDLVRNTSVGAAGIVFEGQVKPDTKQAIKDAEVIRFKSVATIPVSKELQLDNEGSRILENLLEDAAKSLIDAPAVALLTGLDLNSGESVPQLSGVNLYDNGLEFTTNDETEDLIAATNQLVFANGQDNGTLVIDGTLWTALAGHNAPGIAGGRLFPELVNSAGFPFTNTRGGFRYKFIDEANRAKYEVEGVETSSLEDPLLAVVGPFSTNVGASITVNDVRVFHEQWKEVNLASRNIDMYVLEADVALWVLSPEKFNVLKYKA